MISKLKIPTLLANIITKKTKAMKLVLTIMKTEMTNRNHKQLTKFNYTIIRVLLS